MKTLRRLCAVLGLTLALGLFAFAGDISTPGVSSPPPPPPDSQAATTGDMSTPGATGNMSTGYTGDMSTGVTSLDPATEVALSLVQGLLALF